MKTIEFTAWYEPEHLIEKIFEYIEQQEDTELLALIAVNLATELQCWDKTNEKVSKIKKGLVTTLSE